MELGSSPRGEPCRVPPHGPTQLHRGFHGVGAAGHGELAVAEGFLARGADGHWVKVGAAGVLEDDRLGAGVDVSVAPFFERDEDGLKVSPGVSQQVLVAGRTFRILPALDHTRLFEFAQPCCEYVARRADSGRLHRDRRSRLATHTVHKRMRARAGTNNAP
jgi:hypothetical protein